MKEKFKRLPMWAKIVVGFIVTPIAMSVGAVLLAPVLLIAFVGLVTANIFDDDSILRWLDKVIP